MSGNPRAPKGAATGSGARYTPADGNNNTGKTDDVQRKIDGVRDVMKDNMKRALANGEAMENIEEKSNVLLVDAGKFQDSSAGLKRMFCRRNARNIAIISVLAVGFLALIIWWATQ